MGKFWGAYESHHLTGYQESTGKSKTTWLKARATRFLKLALSLETFQVHRDLEDLRDLEELRDR